MKLKEIKQETYELTQTENTKQLKHKCLALTLDKDLRYKSHWLEILQQVKTSSNKVLDLSLEDLAASEKMLKKSLITVGCMAGLTKKQVELDWQRIKLENQFADIHIDEL